MVQLRFDVAANSFFSVLVFNDLLRRPEQGSMALVPQYSTALPSVLMASINQLDVEKTPFGRGAPILPCATQKQVSRFLTLKDINTITMPKGSYSASRVDGF